MGTTGLETAFAALYTELVLPGRARARDGRRADDRRRRRCTGCRSPRIAVGRAGQPLPGRPRRALGGRRGRLREPLGQLLLPRPHAARPRAADGRRRRGRLPRRRCSPRPSALRSSMSRRDRLRPARGRHPLRRARLRRRRARGRRDRVHDLDVRLPGGDDRPQLRRPADHLHLPADRQLRRLAPRRWSPTGSTPAPRSCAPPSTARTRPGAEQRLADLADRLRDPGDHRPRHARARPPHPRRRARCAAGCSRPGSTEAEARALIDAEPSMAGRDLAREVTPARAARSSSGAGAERTAPGSR